MATALRMSFANMNRFSEAAAHCFGLFTHQQLINSITSDAPSNLLEISTFAYEKEVKQLEAPTGENLMQTSTLFLVLWEVML